VRVRLARRRERLADDGDASLRPCDARDDVGDAVRLVREHGHDDGLVDDVPRVDEAREVGELTADAVERHAPRLVEGQGVHPRRLDGVPHERVTLEPHAALGEPSGGGADALGLRDAGSRFEVAAVEGQRRGVEDPEPVLRERGGIRLAIGVRDELETRRAEAEGVPGLRDLDLAFGERRTVRADEPEEALADPVGGGVRAVRLSHRGGPRRRRAAGVCGRRRASRP